jgi:hypothetical protein
MKNNITLAEVAQLIGASQPNGKTPGGLPELNGMRLKRQTFYFAGVSGNLSGNSNEVIIPGALKTPGITNFPTGGMLDAKTYFVCTGVRTLFDTTSTTDPTASTWAFNAPACFKNGEFMVGQDGQPTLFESSGTDVTNFKASTGNDDDFREVGFVWNPQKKATIKLAPVGTVTASTYKVELRGLLVFVP